MKKADRYLKTAVVTILICGGILICVWLGIVLLPSFQHRRAQDKAIQPLIDEAEKLDIIYEEVIASPGKYIDKPVVWCVSHPSGSVTALYMQNGSMPLYVQNYGMMPIYPGVHRSCQDMLFKIKGLTHKKSFSFTAGVKYINVEFVRDFPIR